MVFDPDVFDLDVFDPAISMPTIDILGVMRIWDVDDIKSALISLLKSPAFIMALEKVEHDKGDGIELPRPVAFHTSGKQNLSGTPACELISFPSSQRLDELNHQVVCAWTLSDTDDERLDKMVTRYLTATAYLLIGFRGGSLLPDVPASVTLGRRDYMPPDRTQTPFTQTGIIEISAQVVVQV